MCPGLKKLSQKELLFIILAYDYKGPFHQLDEGERLRRAKRQAFEDGDIDLSKDVKLAQCIDEYKGLQFNVERENQLAYQATIAKLRMQLYDCTDAKKIRDITGTIEYLTGEINKIQDKINTDTEASYTSGGERISFLEQWQLNQKSYKALKQQKDNYLQEQKEKNKTVVETLTGERL